MNKHNFIFAGGYSKRFHTVDTIKHQEIANHSFGVAWFCELITEGAASKQLIMAALTHDLAEHIVGDIPSPAKRVLGIRDMYEKFEMDQLKANDLAQYMDLHSEEAAILKLADMLEGCMYCIRERRLGNRNVEICFNRFYTYANEVAREISGLPKIATVKLLNQIREEMENEKHER